MKTLEEFKKRAERYVLYEHKNKGVRYYPETPSKFKYYECYEPGCEARRVHTKKDAIKFLEGK